jgi:cytochrome c peroxidase
MKNKIILLAFIAIGLMLACKKMDIEEPENYSSSPVLPATAYSYPHSINNDIATLGRVLFYDKNLSLNNSISCASCHQQAKAFCDNKQFSTGLEDLKTLRNSPSIFAKQGRMFWDGRAGNINNLVLRPIKNHVEMKFEDLNKLATKLSKISYYNELFVKAYGSSDIDSIKIQDALASFIANFTFSNNKFSQSQFNPQALNASENLGKDIFFGRGKCSTCHHLSGSNNGYGFTDDAFNIGLDVTYADKGVGGISNNSQDDGKFMIPTLLNVEFTAPYMHDGRFNTLEEVVEHYNSGVKNHLNLDVTLRETASIENLTEQEILLQFDTDHDGNISPSEISVLPTQKLNLTVSDKKNLVDFLKTLSDGAILTDKRFKNPFKY